MSSVAMKDARIQLRVHSDTKDLLNKAALLQHKQLSTYMIDAALEQARHDIQESEVFSLNNQDRDTFFSLLTSPPEPNEDLKALFR